jgi:hypothetical protein
MLDSNVHFAGLTAPSMLDDMRAQLDQAKAAGQKPVNWLVRMEIMATLCEQARAAGELTGEAAHIFGIMVRGSWLLQPRRSTSKKRAGEMRSRIGARSKPLSRSTPPWPRRRCRGEMPGRHHHTVVDARSAVHAQGLRGARAQRHRPLPEMLRQPRAQARRLRSDPEGKGRGVQPVQQADAVQADHRLRPAGTCSATPMGLGSIRSTTSAS